MLELVRYVRDKKRRPKGVMMAILTNNTVYTGWSLCNTKMGDIFNKKLGKDIARGRCFDDNMDAPAQTVRRTYHSIVMRAEKLYANKEEENK